MNFILRENIRVAFAPPRYIALPFSGIDLSTSGIKAVRLAQGMHGLTLVQYAETRFPTGVYVEGEIVDRTAVVEALSTTAKAAGIYSANVALSESKSYLFETTVTGKNIAEWRIEVEQRLDELIPLPPSETAFDIVKVGHSDRGNSIVAGVGFARRIVENTLSVFDQANIEVRALEGETFASSRALLPYGNESTVLIIDVGRTTTKISIVVERIPRFATTIDIGGHSLTLAVQKHFGVTETEARRIKAERGIVPAPGNEDYLSSMLSTVSAIRDEISHRLEYWQGRAALHEAGASPVSSAILVGGNASVRGFAEYLEGALRVPVTTGDVFINLAPRSVWIPDLDYTESLAFATVIGLALRDRDHLQSYA